MHGLWPRPVKWDSESVKLSRFPPHPSDQAVRSVGCGRFLKHCSALKIRLLQLLLTLVEDSTDGWPTSGPFPGMTVDLRRPCWAGATIRWLE